MNRRCFSVQSVTSDALRPLNYLGRRTARAKGAPDVALGELVGTVGAGYKNLFANVDVEPGHGVEVLSQTDMFAAEPSGRHIRRDCLARPENHLIRKWQILIAGAGQMGEGNLFGRSIIADGRLAGKYVAYHALDVAFPEPGSDVNLYVYAFLNTLAGLLGVRSCAVGTSVPALRIDLLTSLRVPVPQDESVTGRVASLVRTAVELREQYLTEMHAARAVIEELAEMRDARAACFARRAQVAMWRGPLPTLAAWNFASSGGALEYLSRKWRGRLGDVVPVEGVFRGTRAVRVECEPPFGVRFVSQRDAFLIRGVERRVRLDRFKGRWDTPRGCTLLAAQGSDGEGNLFGRASYVSQDDPDRIFSEHLMRVIAAPKWRALVFVFLSTPIGFRLVRSTAVGTAQRSMREDLLRQLPLPELSAPDTTRLERHLTAAVEARERAEQAESDAVRVVEEEVLPAWLD